MPLSFREIGNSAEFCGADPEVCTGPPGPLFDREIKLFG